MKKILCLVASMFIALTANAGTTMQGVDNVPDSPRDATPQDKIEKPSRKTRLSELSEANRTRVTFVYKDNCLRFTGSRLLRDDRGDNQRCAPSNGRVYIREDIDTSVTQMLR